MSRPKKVLEEIIKDIKFKISDMSRTFDTAVEPSKIIMTELIEYFKQRSELEADYAKSLSNLGDKFTERISKVSQLLKFSENGLEKRYETFNFMKTIESELKTRCYATMNLSNTIESVIIPMSTKYIIFHAAKVAKGKEILNCIEENLIEEVCDAFIKRDEYEKAFNKEFKSSKTLEELKTHLIKSKRSYAIIDQKINKRSAEYQNDLIQTDKCRNKYLLAHYSTKCCQERLFSQQVKDIVLFLNFKFGDFWKFYRTSFVDALSKCNDYVTTSLTMFAGLSFSDEKETDLILDRYKEKLVKKNIFMPLLLSKSDAINKIILSKSLKTEFEMAASESMDSIKLMNHEINIKILKMSHIKDSKIEWDKDYKQMETVKDSKSTIIRKKSILRVFFNYEDYFKQAEEYVKLDSIAYYNKMKYDRMIQILVSSVESKESMLRFNEKNILRITEFGVDLIEYCHNFDVNIPAVISICVEHLNNHNLLGNANIFMNSPTLKELTEAKVILMNSGKISESASAICVATIMKEYIRNLKNFITFKDIPLKIEDISYLNEKNFIYESKRWLLTLPKSSRNLLVYLLKFIKHITKKSNENKITLTILSTIFSQVVFCPDSNEKISKLQQYLTIFIQNMSDKIYEICQNEPVLFEIEKVQQKESENEKIDLIEEEYEKQSNTQKVSRRNKNNSIYLHEPESDNELEHKRRDSIKSI